MIPRRLESVLLQRLAESPAVVLLGPRQVGKTTLALAVAERLGGLYLDLESDHDLAKLADPALYLGQHLDRLVVLDEIHRVPGLFRVLRGLIDRARREGRRSGLYLLLGSASLDMLRQSGETLAGRVSYLELAPFDLTETGAGALPRLWLRGGFPESFLAPDDGVSFRWRADFIRTYLERDIPQLGRRIPAEHLRRFWTLLAHQQGSLLNGAALARALGMDVKTVHGYLDLLVDLLLLRRLAPWHANVRKRIVRSPKLYLRDSGVLHALLGISDLEALQGSPGAGTSWEGFVIEQLLNVSPQGSSGFFYRTHSGAEIDLLLVLPEGERWAIGIKRSPAARPRRGFHRACEDLTPERRLLVHAGEGRHPLPDGIEAVGLATLVGELAARAHV